MTHLHPRPAAAPTMAHANPHARPHATRCHTPGPRSECPALLLVEQDPLLRWALYETLAAAHYRLLPIRDEQQAHELLDHLPEPLAAAVIDEEAWPLTDACHTWLRARWPDLPILVLAHDATPDLLRQIERMGRAELLLKPFEIDELRTRVAALLQRGQHPAATRQ